MRVTFVIFGRLHNTYVLLNKVTYIRVTGNKVCIWCQDGRHLEFKHSSIGDFAVENDEASFYEK